MTSDNYLARKVAREEAAAVLEAIDNFGMPLGWGRPDLNR